MYFAYRKFGDGGRAKAAVLFGEQELREETIKATHEFVNQYLRFEIRRELNCQLFNGFLSKLQVRLGSGAFIESPLALKQFVATELQLPAHLRFD